MAQRNNAFSDSAERIRHLIHANIEDIDSLLRSNPNEHPLPPTQTERDTHVAQTADLEAARQCIEYLEGSVRYYQDDSENTRRAFDNLKKEYQDLQARENSGIGSGLRSELGLGAKEAGYKKQITKLKESLAVLQGKFEDLEKEHWNCKGKGVKKIDDTALRLRLGSMEREIESLKIQYQE